MFWKLWRFKHSKISSRTYKRRRLHMEALEVRTLLTANPVYVDDDWFGTTPGTDPATDPVGGLVFGTNAFADIQSAINNVSASGSVYIFGGNYGAAVNINQTGLTFHTDTNTPFFPAQTTVAINGAVTVSQSADFITDSSGGADLTFGSTIDDSVSNGHSIGINGALHAIGLSGTIGATPLANFQVTASSTLTQGSSISAGFVSLTSTGSIALKSITTGLLSVNSGGAVTNAASASIHSTNLGSFIGTTSVTLGDQSGDSLQFGNLSASSAGPVKILQDSAMALDLVSGTAITLYSTGAITDNNGAATNVSASTSAELVSGDGIGTAGDFIETNVPVLAANGASVGVFITNNSANLEITTVGSTIGATATGPVNIATNGNLTLTQPVIASGAAANLSAGSSGPANILVNAGVSGTTAQINGGANADTFTINALGSSALTLDGAGGGDTYNINWGSIGASGTVNISDSGGSGADQAIINGTASGDTFGVSETQTTFNGTGIVNYSTTLEQLRVNGLAGNDTFNASPSRFATILIDGGSPSIGQPNAPGGTPNGPGDVLNFNSLGNSAGIAGNVINTNGGSPAFKSVTYQDIEKVSFPTLGTTTSHYDFNASASSLTQAGYTAVLPTRLFGTGTPGSDYGWVTSIPTGGFDRGPNASAFSNLIRDGQYGFAGAANARTFRANVTNGSYLVSVKMGDTGFGRDLMQVSNGDSGEVLVSNINTAAGQVAEREFIINVTDGSMDLKFSDLGGDQYWTLNGIDIRPAVINTEGFAPQGPFTADGTTVDTFTALNVTPNAEVTVSTNLGKITSADVDPNIQGIQVLANGSGQASIAIQRPTGGGTAIVTLQEVTGAQNGFGTVTYIGPSTRQFDFNTASSPTASGYVGVLPTDVYTSNVGYGWVGSIPTGGFDRGGADSLLRDGQYGFAGAVGARTFQADVPNGSYTISVVMGDTSYGRDFMQVTDADTNTVELSNINTVAGQFYQNDFNVNVSDGSLDLTFSDLGNDPYWVLNAIQIRPTASVANITVTAPGGSLAADGMTTDTFSVTAAPGSLVTLSTTLGTITGVADANPQYAGIQVVGTGAPLNFGILRPTAAGIATITARDVTGAALGTATQTYVVAATRRFDFNGPSNTTAVGYLGVRGTNVYSTSTGFGWNLPVLEFDRGTASAATVALYQDGAWGPAGAGGARTFQVQVVPGGTYGIRVYVGDVVSGRDNIQISTEGGGSVLVPTTLANQFTTAILTGVDDGDGVLNITIQDLGNDPYWVINGLDIALGGVGSLPAASPLQVAALGPGGAAAGPALTASALATIVQEAIARWQAAGIGSQAVTLLKGVQFQITNLDGARELGLATPGRVQIDDNGDGYGWFVDSTPKTNTEFATKVGTTELDAVKGSAAFGRMDLLTVVMHELGHELGLADIPSVTNAHALMTDSLVTGVRRLPPAMTPSMVKPMTVTSGQALTLGNNSSPAAAPAADLAFAALGTWNCGAPTSGNPVPSAAFNSNQQSATPLRIETNLAALQPTFALQPTSLQIAGGAPKKPSATVDAVFEALGR